MDEIQKALVIYVSALAEGSECTHHAANRPRYERHLAQAALMFLAIHGENPLKRLKALVKGERHSYGWDFMEGEDGNATESAFNAFANMVESA